MVQIIFYVTTFVMGCQLVFGKIDESKLKPGLTAEEVNRKSKIAGYCLMALPVILFIVSLLIGV